MARTSRAAISLVLLLLFAAQACVRPQGPPTPMSPRDPAQVQAIEEAFQVRVVAVGDTIPLRFYEAELTEYALTGREPYARQRTEIPFDSIATVQVYGRNTTTYLVVGGLAIFALFAVAATPVWPTPDL